MVTLAMVITVSRASAWADPWSQMAREAQHHPQSSRTAYEFGRLSVVRAGRTGDAQLLAAGLAAMERSLFLRGGTQPQVGLGSLLNYASNHGDAERLERYLGWVRKQPRSRVRTRVLDIVASCQLSGV